MRKILVFLIFSNFLAEGMILINSNAISAERMYQHMRGEPIHRHLSSGMRIQEAQLRNQTTPEEQQSLIEALDIPSVLLEESNFRARQIVQESILRSAQERMCGHQAHMRMLRVADEMRAAIELISPQGFINNSREQVHAPTVSAMSNIFDYTNPKRPNPKRNGDDYTSYELGVAGAMLQGTQGGQDGMLIKLEKTFSTQRALKLLNDIIAGEDNSINEKENS